MSAKKDRYPELKPMIAASKKMGAAAGKAVNRTMVQSAEEAITRGISKPTPYVQGNANVIAAKKVLLDELAKSELQEKYSPASAILYKKMPGDMILITGFRNILTGKEIESKYGKDVWNIYQSSDFVIGRFNAEGIFGISVKDVFHVFPGKVYQKKHFAGLVVTLKSAGKLLAGIVAACKNSEVKAVEL